MNVGWALVWLSPPLQSIWNTGLKESLCAPPQPRKDALQAWERRLCCSTRNLLKCRTFLCWSLPLGLKLPTGPPGMVSGDLSTSLSFPVLVFPEDISFTSRRAHVSTRAVCSPKFPHGQGEIYHQPVPSPVVCITFPQTPQWHRTMLKPKSPAIPGVSSQAKRFQ